MTKKAKEGFCTILLNSSNKRFFFFFFFFFTEWVGGKAPKPETQSSFTTATYSFGLRKKKTKTEDQN